MVPRWFMVALVAALLGLTFSVAYTGHVSAKSSKQDTTVKVLCDVEGVLTADLPKGCPDAARRYQQFQQQQVDQQNHVFYCVNQDAIAAVNHRPTAPGCDGTPPHP